MLVRHEQSVLERPVPSICLITVPLTTQTAQSAVFVPEIEIFYTGYDGA